LSLIIVVVLGFAIVVPPLFNIERYQHRIADNISRSLGRPVHFSHISLRLLPRPGFDLSDFTIEEGPDFGAEPILHSSSVSASIRLWSMWRGRLEIARIALDEPSLNLVRNAQGRWNFASVLTEASRTSIAPTGQVRPSSTLRFPYIEATNARINFKYGDEKQPFSFTNGDLAVWLENPNEWQLRFKAQPVRTDLDLYVADTGMVRMEGSLQRAASLGTIPLNLRVDWERAPLGQVGRLFAGSDPGWRGDLDVRSRVKGTPDKLLVSATLDLAALHRVEFAPDRALDYSAKCTGAYEKSAEQISNLACVLPLGNGNITTTGTIVPHAPQLDIAIHQAPASAGLSFFRLMRSGFGRQVALDGDFNGLFHLTESNNHFSASGSVSSDRLAMSAPNVDGPLVVGPVRITALPATRPARGVANNAPASLLLAPIKIDFDGTSPMLIDGRFDPRGFQMHFGGGGSLARLVPMIHSFGLFAPGLEALQPTGQASLDVLLRGPWMAPLDSYDGTGDHPNLASSPTGTITLHDARLETSYLSAPLLIKTAQASLFGTQIAWSGIAAQYGPVKFTGNFRAPLPCAPGDACVRQFDLAAPTLDLATLPGVMVGNSPLIETLLHRFEGGASAEWPALHGTVRAATATLGSLTMQDAVATLDVSGAGVKIDSLDARALDGTLHLSGTVRAGSAPSYAPVYALDAQLNQAAVPAIGQLFRQNWGTGTINVATHLTLSGLNQEDLLNSAQGMYHFDWSKGGLHAVAKGAARNGSPFTRFEEWTADGTIGKSAFVLEQSLLTETDGARSIQGTIGFDRKLDLKSSEASSTEPSGEAGELTGTLAEPVFSLSAAQP
jgi:hypothetical protein